MGKILFWLVIILGALFVARLVASKKLGQRAEPPLQPAKGKQAAAHENMVRCAHCHIYLPRSEALLAQGETWCCEEHAKQGRKPTPK